MPQKFTQITKTCLTCGKEFKVILRRKNTAKFCSRKCIRNTWSKGTKGLFKPNSGSFKKGNKSWNEGLTKKNDDRLKNCGNNISKAKKGCVSWNKGLKCPQISRANSGEKNCNWKGGITPIAYKIRNSIEYKLWREAVFERDDWTCKKTKIKGGVLRAHHIKNFAKFPELRFVIDNGITLSDKSHRKFHKIYGKKNNNQKQLKEFLSE